MAKADMTMKVLLVLVAVAVYAMLAAPICDNFGFCPLGGAAPAPAPTNGPIATCGNNLCDAGESFQNCPGDCGCPFDGATMTIGPMKEKWNPSTTITTGARVFVEGVDRGVKADSSTMDVNFEDDIDIYYAENETAASVAYYTSHSHFTVPCTSAFSTADQDGMEELIAVESSSNDLSFKIFCEDDGLLNSHASSEDISSGEVISLEFKFKPTFEDGWSPYCEGVFVVEGNSSAYDKLMVDGWTETTVPSQHTIYSTINKAWAYEVPLITPPTSGSYETITASLTIDAKAVTITNDTVSSINITWYDCDWYRNTNTGKMEQGVEDNDAADVGDGNIQDNVYIQ